MSSKVERTDPQLWEHVKRDLMRSDKGGKRDQWSARKAQLAVQEYKRRGGGYHGRKPKETGISKWTQEHRDQPVILAVVVLVERLKSLISKAFRSDSRGRGNRAELRAGVMEDADHRPAAVVAAREDRTGQSHEAPHQIERLGGIGLRHVVDNGAALCIQIVHQRPSVLPVNERA